MSNFRVAEKLFREWKNWGSAELSREYRLRDEARSSLRADHAVLRILRKEKKMVADQAVKKTIEGEIEGRARMLCAHKVEVRRLAAEVGEPERLAHVREASNAAWAVHSAGFNDMYYAPVSCTPWWHKLVAAISVARDRIERHPGAPWLPVAQRFVSAAEAALAEHMRKDLADPRLRPVGQELLALAEQRALLLVTDSSSLEADALLRRFVEIRSERRGGSAW